MPSSVLGEALAPQQQQQQKPQEAADEGAEFYGKVDEPQGSQPQRPAPSPQQQQQQQPLSHNYPHQDIYAEPFEDTSSSKHGTLKRGLPPQALAPELPPRPAAPKPAQQTQQEAQQEATQSTQQETQPKGEGVEQRRLDSMSPSMIASVPEERRISLMNKVKAGTIHVKDMAQHLKQLSRQ